MGKQGRNASLPTRDYANAVTTWDNARLEALYDIRDRLDRIVRVLECGNALRIPHVLDKIAKNTTKPKRRKKGTP